MGERGGGCAPLPPITYSLPVCVVRGYICMKPECYYWVVACWHGWINLGNFCFKDFMYRNNPLLYRVGGYPYKSEDQSLFLIICHRKFYLSIVTNRWYRLGQEMYMHGMANSPPSHAPLGCAISTTEAEFFDVLGTKVFPPCYSHSYLY